MTRFDLHRLIATKDILLRSVVLREASEADKCAIARLVGPKPTAREFWLGAISVLSDLPPDVILQISARDLKRIAATLAAAPGWEGA